MDNVYVVSAVRTAVGKSRKGSAIAHVRPDDMGAVVLAEVVKRSGIAPERFEECLMGCAFPEAEAGMNVGRIAALAAGLPDTVAGATINRFCSSGLEAMASVGAKIECGMLDIAVAGGLESMSVIPMGGNKTCPNPKLAQENPRAYTSMGQCADNVAKDFDISREECDRWAVQSNERALAAIKEGRFKGANYTVGGKGGEWEILRIRYGRRAASRHDNGSAGEVAPGFCWSERTRHSDGGQFEPDKLRGRGNGIV